MEMPKPGEAHEKLACGAGVWIGEEKMPPSPWAPDGIIAVGRHEARMALGGFALITDYRQTVNDATTYEGHSVTVYDDRAQRYLMYWFDSMGSPGNVFTGDIQGGEMVMVGPGLGGGKMRNTSNYAEDGVLTVLSETSTEADQWLTALEARYERQV
jgi:hypothetical protein